MKFDKIMNTIFKIFWIFVIGSVFGFFAEMLYALVYTRMIEIRRGLLYGPFIQVYGIGAVAYYLLVSRVENPKKVFFIGMIAGGILEYLCSFLQEVFFGTISWDYSNLFMNINGRTSLLYCFYWGIIGVAYLKVVKPYLIKLDNLIEIKWVRVLTYFFMIFMIFDITISCMAGARQEARRKKLPPKNKIEIFIDEKYPDSFMDKIYNNKKNI